jgi:adenylate kinase
MTAVVLLGPPGAGKGTVADGLVDIGFTPVSTGKFLREQIRLETPVGIEAKKLIDHGQFVPDHVANHMIHALLESATPNEKFLFDGFPRTLAQAERLDEFMPAFGGTVAAVLLLECSDEVLIRRLTGRRTCVGCGATYHMSYNPPKAEGYCDFDECKLELRPDDEAETVKKRLAVYKERTEPLISYYREKGLIRPVNASLGIEAVREAVLQELG